MGEGSFSNVYKGKYQINLVKRISDDTIYALKKVNMSKLKPKEKENSLNEVRILASINTPYIIQYKVIFIIQKEAFLEENSNSLCMVMELAQEGDLT